MPNPSPRTSQQKTASKASSTQAVASSEVRELQIRSKVGTTLSAEMKAFNRALAKIKKIKAQMAELETLGQHYYRQHKEVLDPLVAQSKANYRELVLRLDAHLCAIAEKRQKSLSKMQHQTAVTLICELSQGLSDEHADMAEIHDRYSKTSLNDIEETDMAEKRQIMEDLLRQMGGQMPEDTDAMSPEDMIKHIFGEAQRLSEEERERRAERAAQRAAKQKSKAKPDSPQAQAIANQEQAEQTLKTLFRQIASRLHPDREPDEAERQRKTSLMSEANAAYERKDLVALMQIQLQAELVDPDHASRLSAQRLNELTLLLKQQAASLETERQALQAKWSSMLEVPLGMPLNAEMLNRVLTARRLDLEDNLEIEARDLALVQTEAGLKTFLKDQRKLIREDEKAAQMSDRFMF